MAQLMKCRTSNLKIMGSSPWFSSFALHVKKAFYLGFKGIGGEYLAKDGCGDWQMQPGILLR